MFPEGLTALKATTRGCCLFDGAPLDNKPLIQHHLAVGLRLLCITTTD